MQCLYTAPWPLAIVDRMHCVCECKVASLSLHATISLAILPSSSVRKWHKRGLTPLPMYQWCFSFRVHYFSHHATKNNIFDQWFCLLICLSRPWLVLPTVNMKPWIYLEEFVYFVYTWAYTSHGCSRYWRAKHVFTINGPHIITTSHNFIHKHIALLFQ